MQLRIASIVVGAAALVPVAPAQHRVLVQGNGRLALVGPDREIEWEMPWGPIHDLHVLPSGRVMLQRGPAEVVELDLATREVVWSYDSRARHGGRPVEVHALQPLADGRVMIAESGPGRVIVVDRAGEVVREVPLTLDRPHPHTDTRLARVLDDGNVLVCHEGDGVVREYAASDGMVVWQFDVPLFGREPRGGHGPESFGDKCFAALRLPGGDTLVATGNGHSVLRITPAGEVAWKLEQDDLEGVTLAWVTTLEVLPNGNLLVGNCHAGPGQPVLIEVEPATKRVVWRFDGYEAFGNDVSNTRRWPDSAPLPPRAPAVAHSFFVAGPDFTGIVAEDGCVAWDAGRPGARDGWVLPGGNVLVAWADRVVELTPAREEVFAYTLSAGNRELGTAERLEGGNTLVTELGPRPRLLELDPRGAIVIDVPLQPETDDAHMQTRMARKLANGNYLVPHLLAFAVKEYTPRGEVVRTLRTDLAELGGRAAELWPFTAIRLGDGATLVGLTHGNQVVELDRDGGVVWRLSNDDLPGRPIADACGVQRLANGNTVVTSYAAREGVKLLEVERGKRVVWQYTGPFRAHHVQVLTTNGSPEPLRAMR